MNIYSNDEPGPFKFEHDLNKMPYSRFGKWNKVPALTDVHSPVHQKIGEIKSIIGDLANNRIEFVVFQFNQTLGLGQKNYFLPWHKFNVQNTSDVVFTPEDLNILKNAPSFHQNHWPDNTDVYIKEVKEYWNVN